MATQRQRSSIMIDRRTGHAGVEGPLSDFPHTPAEHCHWFITDDCLYSIVTPLESTDPCCHCGSGGGRRNVTIANADGWYVWYDQTDGCMSDDDEYTVYDYARL